MTSAVDEYLSDRQEFQRIEDELDRYAEITKAVATALGFSRGRFIFSNTQPGLPAEAGMAPDSKSVDGRGWPTAEQIQEALSRWHDAKHKMHNAWNQIPNEHRAALQKPPHLQR